MFTMSEIPTNFDAIPIKFNKSLPSWLLTQEWSSSSPPPPPPSGLLRLSSTATTESLLPLGDDYTVRATDVVCGRGKAHVKRAGNLRLRALVAAQTDAYNAAKTKFDKTMVLSAIVEQVHDDGGRFVKPPSTSTEAANWSELSNDAAREKVGHLMRLALKMTKERCSTSTTSSDYSDTNEIGQEEGDYSNPTIANTTNDTTDADMEETTSLLTTQEPRVDEKKRRRSVVLFEDFAAIKDPDEKMAKVETRLRHSIVFCADTIKDILGDNNESLEEGVDDLQGKLRASVIFSAERLKELVDYDDEHSDEDVEAEEPKYNHDEVLLQEQEENVDDGRFRRRDALQSSLRASVSFPADTFVELLRAEGDHHTEEEVSNHGSTMEPLDFHAKLRQSILFSAQKYIFDDLEDSDAEDIQLWTMITNKSGWNV